MSNKANIQFELGCSLVLVELDHPLVVRERGEDAGNGSPFRDAQSGFRESSNTSDDDDAQDQG